MKKQLVLIVSACILALFCLSTCGENPQVIGILRDASELTQLEIIAYSDELPLAEGTSIKPGFSSSVYNYTVTVAKDTTRFVISASIDGEGTVTGFDERDQEEGLEIYFYEPVNEKVVTVTAQLKHMDKAEYRLTVVRGDTVPVAEHINLTISPSIGSFFIGSGVYPELDVSAQLPAAGGELTYQWYMNTANSTRSGYPIKDATGTTYKMQRNEVYTERTMYYYVEITNTLNGRTGVTTSPTRAVSFLNKAKLDHRSQSMVNIPVGYVRASDPSDYPDSNVSSQDDWRYIFGYGVRWDTPGFSIGQYLVTWELWKIVMDYARDGGYFFSRLGNQGGAIYDRGNSSTGNTNITLRSVGNELHPVTNISWNDAVVWCNAYSEMEGIEPVYRDSNGNVLRDSGQSVATLIDVSKMAGKNGYRLPTEEEWFYAGKGANPIYDEDEEKPWYWSWPGINVETQAYNYVWCYSPQNTVGGNRQTGEVGTLLPNRIGLYDILGMVYQYIWYGDEGIDGTQALAYGVDFKEISGVDFGGNISNSVAPAQVTTDSFTGFRVVKGGL